jgi:hypothetical protein
LTLRISPPPPEAKALHHPDGAPSGILWFALDEWRIVYQPDDDAEIVELIKVGGKRSPEFY